MAKLYQPNANPFRSGPTRLATGPFAIKSQMGLSGGGGFRTRVPRHVHKSLYVRSRLFGIRPEDLCRPSSYRTSRKRCLTTVVSGMNGSDSELVTSFWASPTNPLSRGCLSLGSQCEVTFGK